MAFLQAISHRLTPSQCLYRDLRHHGIECYKALKTRTLKPGTQVEEKSTEARAPKSSGSS